MHIAEAGAQDFRTVWMDTSDGPPMIRMIDQTKLPFDVVILDSRSVERTCRAITDMNVRGAGAIGATAGYGMAQGFSENNPEQSRTALEATRPTAYNLFYATERVYNAAVASEHSVAAAWEEAQMIADEDVASCMEIGRFGSELIPEDGQILTHCNAGWLAFVDWGTALSPVYVAHRAGNEVKVYADETQPRQQGGRLTAWELQNEGVDHEISPDTNLADVLENEGIDLVIVGADRIAANGDTANKIGTYGVAIVARHFGIPFYVAPTSNIYSGTPSRRYIDIETRSQEEVQYKTGRTRDGRTEEVLVVNPGSPARNRAFDVTPADLIRGIITERGIIKPTIGEILSVKESARADDDS